MRMGENLFFNVNKNKIRRIYPLLIIALLSLTFVFIIDCANAIPPFTREYKTDYAETVGKEYKEITVTNGGRVTGMVIFEGEMPPPKRMLINYDHEFCGKEPRSSPVLEIHPANKGIKNTVVSIENIPEGKSFDASGIHPILDQQRCTFIPHVLVITIGTIVDILNGDNLMHNVHARCIKNSPFNEGITFKQRLSKRFDFEETVKISCDVHKWMSAWIVVRENPYFALTDENGHFAIEDVPPGTYKLQAWHESLATITKEINLNPNEELKVDFSFNQK